jgi:hypothetical protein
VLRLSWLVVSAGACGRSQGMLEQGETGGDAGSVSSAGGSTSVGGMAGADDPGVVGGAGTGGSSAGGAPVGGAGGSSVGGSGAGAGGANVGGAGAAGAPLTDAEVCADSCSQTDFFLPSALCEDWQFPDDRHVAEYCALRESPDCVGRCEEQLGGVSPACRAALHRALPCVSRSTLYQGGVPAIDCLFEVCTPMLLRVSAECNGLRQELAVARERWTSEGSASYSYKYDRDGAMFDIVVRDGVALAVEGLRDPPTIPALFDEIERYFEVAPASVIYDPELGYPATAGVRSLGCLLQVGFSFTVSDLVLD